MHLALSQRLTPLSTVNTPTSKNFQHKQRPLLKNATKSNEHIPNSFYFPNMHFSIHCVLCLYVHFGVIVSTKTVPLRIHIVKQRLMCVSNLSESNTDGVLSSSNTAWRTSRSGSWHQVEHHWPSERRSTWGECCNLDAHALVG